MKKVLKNKEERLSGMAFNRVSILIVAMLL